MLLRIEGFDHQNSAVDLVQDSGPFVWRSAGGCTLVGGLVGPGNALDIGLGLTGVATAPLTKAFFGHNLWIPPGATRFGLWLWNGATQHGPLTNQQQISLFFQPGNGTIQAYRGNWAQGGLFTPLGSTPTNSFPNGAAFFFELGAKIDPSSGSLTLKINGNAVLTVTGISTSTDGTQVFDSIAWAAQSGVIIDDFYLCDDAVGPGPTPYDTFVGPSQVITEFVAANSAVAYAPLSGTNSAMVQETAMDGDATYNFDQTVGHEDLFTITPLPVTANPIAVQVTGAYRQDQAGTRAVANHLKSAGSDESGVSRTLGGDYVYQHDVWPADPNGNIAWTRTSVDAALIGYQTTN